MSLLIMFETAKCDPRRYPRDSGRELHHMHPRNSNGCLSSQPANLTERGNIVELPRATCRPMFKGSTAAQSSIPSIQSFHSSQSEKECDMIELFIVLMFLVGTGCVCCLITEKMWK
jgi:hypothetical protein